MNRRADVPHWQGGHVLHPIGSCRRGAPAVGTQLIPVSPPTSRPMPPSPLQINCRCWRRCQFQLRYTLGRDVPRGQCDNGAMMSGQLCIDNIDSEFQSLRLPSGADGEGPGMHAQCCTGRSSLRCCTCLSKRFAALARWTAVPNGTYKRGSTTLLGGVSFKLASGNALSWTVVVRGQLLLCISVSGRYYYVHGHGCYTGCSKAVCA